ncbi:MAG: ExbD/TolR family protein, partial [Myxococcales bacterium]
VLISEKGFFVAGSGAVLPGGDGAQQEGTEGAPTVAVNEKGEYDYASLTRRMLEIKTAFPEESKVIIGADAKIPYDVLVKTMDAVREHKGQNLFFDVSLTIL